MTSNIYHNWDEEPISKITKTLIDYRGKTPEKTDSGVRLITAKVIKEGFIQEGNDEYISEDTYKEWMTRGFPQKEDILITTEAPLGEVAQLRTDEKIAIAQRIILLRGKEKIINQKYYYYVLRSYLVQKRIESYGTGTTVLGIKQKQLKKVLVPLPPKPIQDGIVFILSKIDDLLEINKNKIKVLEEMAQLLYREWFVEFRFPGYEDSKFVDSELGKIPDGWFVSRVSDVAKISRGISYRSENLVDNGIPFFTINSLYRNGGFKLDGLKFYEGNYKESQLIKPNEIIIGVTDMTQARLIVGSVARIPSSGIEDGLISMDLVKAKAKTGYSNEYVYSMLRYSDFTRTVKEFANGANVLHLSPKHIEKFQFALPNKDIRDHFAEVVSPIYQLMDNLVRASVLLAKTRDLLLPKLMSGEIDVSKLDINITEN